LRETKFCSLSEVHSLRGIFEQLPHWMFTPLLYGPPDSAVMIVHCTSNCPNWLHQWHECELILILSDLRKKMNKTFLQAIALSALC
jgi:hypothetical protein